MTYIIENGLRKVLPYYKIYKTHIKTRWENRTILDIFTNELGQLEDIVRQEINDDKLFVVAKFGFKAQTDIKGAELYDRLIVKHDVIYNSRHIHEPVVVIDDSILPNDPRTMLNIVYEDNDLIVINKPSGLPTHPTSSYRYNSVLEILKHDLGIDVWTTHRLDKVTSGVLIFSKNKSSANKLMSIITNKSVTMKQYFARVKGQFPPGINKIVCPIFLVNANGGYLMPSNTNELTLATTIFERIDYDNQLNESLVKCTPISGKMHQIRIHLRNLGFPIVNDFFYNNASLVPVNKLKNEIELEIYNSIYQQYPQFNQLHDVLEHFDVQHINVNSYLNDEINLKLKTIKQLSTEKIDSYKNGRCDECKRELFDVNHELSTIWLHAFRYQFNHDDFKFDFQTELPKWCNFSKLDTS